MVPTNHVSSRLKRRLRLFLIIGVVLTVFIIYQVIAGMVAWYYVLLAYAIGIIVGYAVGRMLRIRWHETLQEAISETDAAGTIAIILYIAFALGRDWLLGTWFAGAALIAISLAVLGGAVLGRYIGIHQSITRVLKEQGKTNEE